MNSPGRKQLKLELKQAFEEKSHVLPSRSNSQKEVLLRRIATKGVVKLFNAVSAHQKLMSETAKEAKTEAKMSKALDAVNKSSFMELLREEYKKPGRKDETNLGACDATDDRKKQHQLLSLENEETKRSAKPSWKVLSDDFMLGASMKDWDKGDDASKQNRDDSDQVESGSETDE